MIDKEKLTIKDVKEYFKKSAHKYNYIFDKIIDVKEVKKYTNSAYIYEITVRKHNKKVEKVFLKHSKDYLKLTKLKFFVGSKRLIYETKAMEFFGDLFGRGIVPDVIFFDKRNSVLAMSDIHGKGKRLIDEFGKNKVHPEIAKQLGHILGLLHAKTYGTKKMIRGLKENNEMLNLSVKFKTNTGIEICPKETLNLIEETKKNKTSIIWGDALIKNMIVLKKQII